MATDPIEDAHEILDHLRQLENDLQNAIADAVDLGHTRATVADKLGLPVQRVLLMARDGAGWRRWS